MQRRRVAVKVGVPKEVKTHEYRVGMTPAGVRELVLHGHQVTVEHDAGLGIGSDDGAYRAAGAVIGAVMKAMKGQADAARVRELVLERAAG
ncbi:MAG: hypothetical protein J0H57_25115 [Rhodospirillales bacterium]|nr:hypothetical protein [Rhodospirillales bacterium]